MLFVSPTCLSLKIFYGCWQLVWLLLVLISFPEKWCTLCLKIRVITFYLVFIYCAFNETKKRQQPSEERYIEPLHGCKLDGVHFFHEDCFTGGSYRFPCFFFTTLAVLSATKNFHLNGNWMWTKKQTKQKICTCQTKIPQCESVFFLYLSLISMLHDFGWVWLS